MAQSDETYEAAVKIKVLKELTIKQCWQTSDGDTFTDEIEAKRHQIRHNFCNRLAGHLDMQNLSREDRAVIIDSIMEDLDGITGIFETYIHERSL